MLKNISNFTVLGKDQLRQIKGGQMPYDQFSILPEDYWDQKCSGWYNDGEETRDCIDECCS